MHRCILPKLTIGANGLLGNLVGTWCVGNRKLESAARISVHSQKFVDPPLSLECHGSATAQKANGFSVQPGCLEISRSENCFNNFRVSGPASTLPFSYTFHYKSRLVIDEPLLCEYTPTLQSEV